jgi:hypothetical protein
MTKRIKKGNNTHIVAFCPACTSGDPWTVHTQSGYTLLSIDPVNKQVPFLQQRRQKTSEGWPMCPKEIPFYRNSWCSSELYNRPMDWEQQSDEYDKKMKVYEKEKMGYDAFCSKKLREARTRRATETRSERGEVPHIRIEKIPAKPPHICRIYCEEQKHKKQKQKHTFNSPEPKNNNNKENIEI